MLIGLQAERLGQHPPTGTGAGVPSRQILRSMVQKTLAQFGWNAIRKERTMLQNYLTLTE